MRNSLLVALLMVCLCVCLVGCKKDTEPVETSAVAVVEASTEDPFAVDQEEFNAALGITEAETAEYDSEAEFKERVKDLETVAVTQSSGETEIEYVVEDITPTQESVDEATEAQETYEDTRSYFGLTEDGEAVAKLSTITLSSGHEYGETEAIIMDNLIYNWVTDTSLTESYIDETLNSPMMGGLSEADKAEIKSELLKRYAH